MNEFDFIKTLLLPLAQEHKAADGFANDAATLSVPAGKQLVVSSDTTTQDVHFINRGHGDAKRIAQKALRSNVSDILAMGADPYCYQLCLSLPKGALDESFLEEFTQGLKEDQERYGMFLSGGDTTATPGPFSISITAFGLVDYGAGKTRSGARVGDRVYLTGTVGDAYCGLKLLQGEIEAGAVIASAADTDASSSSKTGSDTDTDTGLTGTGAGTNANASVNRANYEASDAPYAKMGVVGDCGLDIKAGAGFTALYEHCTNAAYRPDLPYGLLSAVQEHARAVIDISDGLLADLGHICAASDCGAQIDLGRVAFSRYAQSLIDARALSALDLLSGGDDYQLLMAIAPEDELDFLSAARRAAQTVQKIGEFTAKSGQVTVVGEDGQALDITKKGWQHF